MEFLNYGMGFYFTRDYITKTRNYPKGTRCNILNGVVVLGKDGEFLFDVNSGMAKRFGQIINQDIFDKNEQKWSDLIDKREEYYDRLHTIHLRIIKLEDENNRTRERLGLELERSLDLKTAQDKKDKARQLMKICSSINQKKKCIRKLKRRYNGYSEELVKINKEIESLEKIINDELEIKDIF